MTLKCNDPAAIKEKAIRAFARLTHRNTTLVVAFRVSQAALSCLRGRRPAKETRAAARHDQVPVRRHAPIIEARARAAKTFVIPYKKLSFSRMRLVINTSHQLFFHPLPKLRPITVNIVPVHRSDKTVNDPSQTTQQVQSRTTRRRIFGHHTRKWQCRCF